MPSEDSILLLCLTMDIKEETASLLTNEMGFFKVAHEGNRVSIPNKSQSNEVSINDQDGNEDQKSIQPTSSIVDIVCLPYTQPGTMGAGTVHHVAWRTPTDESQIEMRKKITRTRLNATPVIDWRLYFHSVYFREPGGVLFEIATDPPGFMINQKPEELGQKLVLPKWLEPKREYIEKTLPSIKISNFNQTNQRIYRVLVVLVVK